MQYRPEIDGLRAVAVLPVIAFHAGFGVFSGGFVGVDIFFVISGYLITALILKDLEDGTFSIRRFYERRARRILPALFVVMAVCVPFAWVWMLPDEFISFARSLIAVVLFVSNILFWKESGYFDPAAEEKPLLHTWSLAVEEQFYLLFPLFMLAAWRFGRAPVFWSLVVFSALSLFLAEWGWRNAPRANFFLAPTRAWELLAGALCAFHLSAKPRDGNAALSGLGLVMIIASIFFYDNITPFPSLYAALPVGGTALIILYARANIITGRVLAWKPFLAVGLISYSAYLWHQPLFAFARIRSLFAPDPWLMGGVALASLGLAYLSWRFVEQPFRAQPKPLLSNQRQVFTAATLGSIMAIGLGAFGAVTNAHTVAWERNLPPETRAFYDHMTAASLEEKSNGATRADNGDCIFGARVLSTEIAIRLRACAEKYGPGLAIFGDSHAIDITGAVSYVPEGRQFIYGGGADFCQAHDPLEQCSYAALLDLVAQSPTRIFDQIIYTQSGNYLMRKSDGLRPRGPDLEQPIEHAFPVVTIAQDKIDRVSIYLEQLNEHAPALWMGPRIEPHLPRDFVLAAGCAYPFSLRPNQAETYMQLDAQIAQSLKDSAVDYVSQIALLDLDFTQDFTDCKTPFWADGSHFSNAGEARFGTRMTPSKIEAWLSQEANIK